MGVKLEDWIIRDGNKPGDVLNGEVAMRAASEMNAKFQNFVIN